jgi:hypothetical protein
MGQQPTMWTKNSPRKSIFHLRCKSMALKVEIQEETPQRRSNMERRGMLTSRIHLENPLVRDLITPWKFLAVKLAHILRGEERGGNIPRTMTLKSLRKPRYPLLMGRLKRGNISMDTWPKEVLQSP